MIAKSLTVRRLGRDDLPAMHELLTVFGEAFDEEETYGAARPDDAYLRNLLGRLASRAPNGNIVVTSPYVLVWRCDLQIRSECQSTPVSRKDVFAGAALTIGSALAIAAMMMIGQSELTKTIGLVMVPGVLSIGAQWTSLRERSTPFRLMVVGGTLGVLFLIGLVAGLASR